MQVIFQDTVPSASFVEWWEGGHVWVGQWFGGWVAPGESPPPCEQNAFGVFLWLKFFRSALLFSSIDNGGLLVPLLYTQGCPGCIGANGDGTYCAEYVVEGLWVYNANDSANRILPEDAPNHVVCPPRDGPKSPFKGKEHVVHESQSSAREKHPLQLEPVKKKATLFFVEEATHKKTNTQKEDGFQSAYEQGMSCGQEVCYQPRGCCCKQKSNPMYQKRT